MWPGGQLLSYCRKSSPSVWKWQRTGLSWCLCWQWSPWQLRPRKISQLTLTVIGGDVISKVGILTGQPPIKRIEMISTHTIRKRFCKSTTDGCRYLQLSIEFSVLICFRENIHRGKTWETGPGAYIDVVERFCKSRYDRCRWCSYPLSSDFV